MIRRNIYTSALITALAYLPLTLWAWDHSIEIGYGKSHDPNDSKHYNSGFLLSGDVYPIKHTNWSYWSVNGTLGRWYSTAPQNKNLTTVAASLALRLYPLCTNNAYDGYFMGAAGPALLSNRKFGANTQGSNFTFQWVAGAGVEYDHIDVNFRYMHYSNARLFKPDQGFNIQYLISIGYLF